jgi:hypothetical protein
MLNSFVFAEAIEVAGMAITQSKMSFFFTTDPPAE